MGQPSGIEVVQHIQSGVANPQRTISEMEKKSPGHVLVVDDERLVRWAVAETLGARGYSVSEAGDAKSAMRAFGVSESRADLVLLDLVLPDSCDLGVLRFIRSCAPAIPVILMTAFATPDILEQAFVLGALVMIKPFDMTALAAMVDRAVATAAP
jgi:DNA-binding NtrC family response regulator